MAAPRYYALVASLPRLLHFEQAEYVPITRQQLDSRLLELSPEHAHELDAAIALFRWRQPARARSAAGLIQEYAAALRVVTFPALREVVEYWMGQRTVVAALRMRQHGETQGTDEPWGIEPWVRRIDAHRDESDLGVRFAFPWIEQARAHVETSNAIELERLQLDIMWKKLTEIEGRTSFGFERVIAFVFKWEIVKRWLSYDAGAAKQRFQELIVEVICDHQQVFD